MSSRARIQVVVTPLEVWGQDTLTGGKPICDCLAAAVNRTVFWQGGVRVGVGFVCAKHTPSASTVAQLAAS